MSRPEPIEKIVDGRAVLIYVGWSPLQATRKRPSIDKRKTEAKAANRTKGFRAGDKLTWLFEKVGLTEEKYLELKTLAGFKPTCGCPARRAFLNEMPGVLWRAWWAGDDVWEAGRVKALEIRKRFATPKA